MSQFLCLSIPRCWCVTARSATCWPPSIRSWRRPARSSTGRFRAAQFTSPTLVKDYLRTQLAGFEHEVFAALFLDSQHGLIEYTELFRGTIDSAAVYPREVVKMARLRSFSRTTTPAKILSRARSTNR